MSLSTIESLPDLKVQKVPSPLRRGIFLSLLSALLTALAWPSLPFAWLAWISFVPLGWCLRGASARHGFILAGLFGWGFWFGAIWWVQVPIREILLLSPIAAFTLTLLGCAVLALPYAISGALICILPEQRGGILRSAKCAAIFTVLTSWLPALFDANIAHTQYENHRVLQVLDIGGTPLLLFFILWINWLIVETLAAKREFKAIAIPIAAVVVIFLFLLCYGQFRLADFHAQMKSKSGKNWFTIGSVQPNIPLLVPKERQPIPPQDRTNDFFTALQQAAALVEKNSEIDLLALPENPDLFIFNADEKRRTALADMIVQVGKPVILNASVFDARKPVAGKPGCYSVNVHIDSTAFVTNSYRKTKLVPLIESLPGENYLPWLRRLFPKSLGNVPGANPVIFDIKPGLRVIPLICYEGTSASFTRQFVQLGGNIVINLINDSWFFRTPGAKCHMALASFRAVEFRLPFVRVTNSGMGAFVQPTGEIISGSRTALFEKTATAFPVYIPMQRSFYARHGDWFLVVLTFGLVGAFIFDMQAKNADRPAQTDVRKRHKRKRRSYFYQ